MSPAARKSAPSRKRPTARGKRTDAPAGPRRALLVGCVLFSAVILFAWFPASSLLSGRSTLHATQAQLAGLHAQDAALAQEQKNLSDTNEIERIARQQYQLAGPNQQVYEVLPPAGSASTGTPYAGDPGSDGPAAPSATSELPPGDVTTTTVPPAKAAKPKTKSGEQASGGLFDRMLHSLEFWN